MFKIQGMHLFNYNLVKMHRILKPVAMFWIALLSNVFNQLTAFQEVTICTLFNFQKSDNFTFIKVTIHVFFL